MLGPSRVWGAIAASVCVLVLLTRPHGVRLMLGSSTLVGRRLEIDAHPTHVDIKHDISVSMQQNERPKSKPESRIIRDTDILSNKKIQANINVTKPSKRHFCPALTTGKNRQFDFKVSTQLGSPPFHRNEKGLAKARTVAERMAISIGGRKTVIVVSVNAGYFDFARNLMCSIRSHNTEQRAKLILFAVDKQVGTMISEAAVAGGHYIYDIPDEAYAELPSGPTGQSNQDYGTAKFEWIMLQRTRLISDFLHLGYDVLAGDADQVWMTNPLDYISKHHSTPAEDLLSQPEADGRGCMGFSLLRSTPGMKELFGLLLQNQECLVWNCFRNNVVKLFNDLGDQLIMLKVQKIVNHKRRNLPSDLFPWGSLFFDGNVNRPASKMPVVIHNNYVIGKKTKMERFRTYHVWLLDKDNMCRLEKGLDTQQQSDIAKWYPMVPP